MTEPSRPGSLWRRHRAAFLAAGLIAWVALIAALHLGNVWAGGTTRGAKELLQIGALPVT